MNYLSPINIVVPLNNSNMFQIYIAVLFVLDGTNLPHSVNASKLTRCPYPSTVIVKVDPATIVLLDVLR